MRYKALLATASEAEVTTYERSLVASTRGLLSLLGRCMYKDKTANFPGVPRFGEHEVKVCRWH
jgi:hypothetical protein